MRFATFLHFFVFVAGRGARGVGRGARGTGRGAWGAGHLASKVIRKVLSYSRVFFCPRRYVEKDHGTSARRYIIYGYKKFNGTSYSAALTCQWPSHWGGAGFRLECTTRMYPSLGLSVQFECNQA